MLCHSQSHGSSTIRHTHSSSASQISAVVVGGRVVVDVVGSCVVVSCVVASVVVGSSVGAALDVVDIVGSSVGDALDGVVTSVVDVALSW